MCELRVKSLCIGLLLGITIGLFSEAKAGTGLLRRIGIGPNGEMIDEEIEPAGYAKEFSAIVSSVSDSSLEALNRAGPKNAWKLQTLAVGIGLGAEFGIGPVLKVKASPRLRVVFSRSSDPIVP